MYSFSGKCIKQDGFLMSAECNQSEFRFQGLGSRKVVAEFGAGDASCDGGGLLLREIKAKREWIKRAAGCFTDGRDPNLIGHTVEQLSTDTQDRYKRIVRTLRGKWPNVRIILRGDGGFFDQK
jgi:hypothetical protein